ncbi:hypothetical protein Tco_1342583, partial [Tanacetum coccineum]
MFNNEVEHLSNEYIIRIGKKGYVLDDVWEKCEHYHRKTIDSWHDKGFEEDKLWRSGDEKTDYESPFVDVKNFEVKMYSFKGGKSVICITKQEDDAFPLGCVNGARFKVPSARREFLRTTRSISFDYRVPLGFGSIASGLYHVNLVIGLPLEHVISCNTPKNGSQRNMFPGALLHDPIAQVRRERPLTESFEKKSCKFGLQSTS